AVRIGPCDQVCPRIVPERHECCRAHGRSGYAYCSGGGMYCN
nr:Chain A, Diapausin [Gastrophysa atrocyanea]